MIQVTSVDPLVELARRMLSGGDRSVLGICGAPGAGKSRLAGLMHEQLGDAVALVPMDGFHLQDEELARLGLLDRKGAPETFDADGYVAMLQRIRADTGTTVYAPAFDREREVSLAGAIPVAAEHRLVITEGNYLLLDAPVWRDVRTLLTTCWFLHADDEARRERLVARHVRHGRTLEAAGVWVARTDERNAELVSSTASRADLVADLGLDARPVRRAVPPAGP